MKTFSSDVFAKITHLSEVSVGKQKIISQYFLSHLEEVAFETLSLLSRKAGVSESTIIRFARALGYKGYPDLKEEFHKIILQRLSPSARLGKQFNVDETGDRLVQHLLEKEIQNAKAVQKHIDVKNIELIAHTILGARRKYVIGLRASAGCAHLFGHLLFQILPDVFTITDGDTRLFEALKSIGNKDVLIGVSYPRYTRNTVEALKFAKNRRAKTIAITDSELSPAAQTAEMSLIAPADSLGFENSYTACLIVINVLVTLIAGIDKCLTRRMLREWEESTKGLDFLYKWK